MVCSWRVGHGYLRMKGVGQPAQPPADIRALALMICVTFVKMELIPLVSWHPFFFILGCFRTALSWN